jgi:hypothetical protein
MKTQAYFTCQIKALFIIIVIATFSTFGVVYSALKTSSLQFGETTQINKDMKNIGMNAFAAINNAPAKEKMLQFFKKNADSIPKKVSQDDQFPLYVPFYFFSLGFILVLAHRSIMRQNPRNNKVKDVPPLSSSQCTFFSKHAM